jgi:hypothetical protein
MRDRKRLCGKALALGLTSTLLSSGVFAELNGKTNLLCSADQVVGCVDKECLQGPPSTFGLPHFMFIDFERKVIHGVDDEGEELTSPIKNMEINETAFILQGFENNRGWTMGVNPKDGGLTMSSTGADVNFIITGNCIERSGGK